MGDRGSALQRAHAILDYSPADGLFHAIDNLRFLLVVRYFNGIVSKELRQQTTMIAGCKFNGVKAKVTQAGHGRKFEANSI